MNRLINSTEEMIDEKISKVDELTDKKIRQINKIVDDKMKIIEIKMFKAGVGLAMIIFTSSLFGNLIANALVKKGE